MSSAPTGSGRAGGGKAVIVVSGPSGAGKTTLVRRLLEKRHSNLVRSVSMTTRAPREGERDGIHYFFVTPERFEHEKPNLIEFAKVYDHWYGVPRRGLEAMVGQGKNVILEIDVQGAGTVRRLGIPAVFVFIEPPDLDTLKRRLEERGEGEGEVERRLAEAKSELGQKYLFDVVIVNDDLEEALLRLEDALRRLGILS